MILINDFDPILFAAGPLEVRWYGLCFALGLGFYYWYTTWLFKREKHPIEHLDSLVVYLFVGMLLGARFGHIAFYNLEYYLNNPIDVLKVWEGGLASHGAAIGLVVAYYVWAKVHKVAFSKYGDLLVMAVPINVFFIRMGNFFNSEIIGTKTDGSWGVVYAQLGEDFPRYPVQFYEAFAGLAIFFVMFYAYKKWYGKMPKLFYFFSFFFLYFAARFGAEFWKDLHTLPDSFPLSMGQMLSIVPILAGLIFYIVKFSEIKRAVTRA